MKTTLTIVILAAAATGCGSGGNPGAVDNFIHDLAVAECAWEFRCCTDAEIMQQEMGKFADQATCVQFKELALLNIHYSERLAAKENRISVDGTQASACVMAQSSKACNPAPGAPPPPNPTPGTVDPCTLVFKGVTAVGDACQFQNECVKGAHCVSTGAGAEGVCVPYQEEKQICNTTSDCDPSVFNLYCAKQDFQCHLRSPAGGPCAYTTDMVSGMPTLPLKLECDNTPGTNLYCDPTSNTCATLPGSGQACLTMPPPGVGSQCASGLVCDSGTGGTNTCRGPGMVGDDCTRINCSTTLYCDRTVTPNTCKNLPGLGEMCQPSNFQCAKPYYCNTAMAPYVCAAPAELGQPCSGTIRCDTTLYCDTQTTPAMPTCKGKLPDGSSCTTSVMCLSNQCSFGGAGIGTCTPTTTQVQCIGR
jgi:hypothetical protein